jgi:hypothetical protein
MYDKADKKKLEFSSVVVEFEAHAIVNLIVFECDVILIYRIPFLDPDI